MKFAHGEEELKSQSRPKFQKCRAEAARAAERKPRPPANAVAKPDFLLLVAEK